MKGLKGVSRIAIRDMLDPTRLKQAEALFRNLVELPLRQRDEFWTRQNGPDEEIRCLVEKLLANDESGMTGFLCAPAGGARLWAPEHLVQLPAQIGQFRLIRKIGEGGMGVVYEAQQANPSRTVALKILRGGRFVDEYSLRLFEREIQALARLRHACVGAIYEAGHTDDGQHYFAMEFVQGRSLLDHVREKRLGFRSRLELFCRICDAIHYAHQRGVMHRDLKPSNILIDEASIPKILDFGLARILDADLLVDAPATVTGRIQGTLSYMSPEQARGDNDALDTRTDVYSLGVILYELLTDRLPYDVIGVPLPEAVDIISSRTPARFVQTKHRLPSDEVIKPDLQTIVLKALEKEPSRRYASASALLEDIQRFLTDQPILARPASTTYLLRKLVLRHQWPSAIAAAAFVFLVGFGIWMSVLYRQKWGEWQRAEFAEQKAVAAGKELVFERDDARQARDAHAEQRRLAELERARAESVTNFLLVTLGLADPDVTQTFDVSMKDMLALASAQAGQWFEDQPESEVRVRTVIGRAYAALGELESAKVNLRRAMELHEGTLGSKPRELYETLSSFVQVLGDVNDFEWPSRRRQLSLLPAVLLNDVDPNLAVAVAQLRQHALRSLNADLADPVRTDIMQRVESLTTPENALLVADILEMAGDSFVSSGKPEFGSVYLQNALSIQRRFLPETNTRVVRTLGSLIHCLILEQDYSSAENLTRDAMAILQRILPQNHWYIAVFRGRLGAAMIGQQQFEEAEQLLIDSLNQITAARGEFVIYRREMLHDLANLYDAWGRPNDATQQRISLASFLAGSDRPTSERWVLIAFGSSFPHVTAALEQMGRSVASRKRDITPELEELLRARQAEIPDDHVLAALVAELLHEWETDIFHRAGFDQTTLRMNQEVQHIMHAAQHLHHWKRAGYEFSLAWNLEALGVFSEAEPPAREAVRILEERFGNRDCFLSNARSIHGACLVALKRFDEAEPLLVQSFAELMTGQGPASQNTINALNRLVNLYAVWGRPREAIKPLVAYSKLRAVYPAWLEPILPALQPQLALCMERLRTSPRGDRAELAARIADLLNASAVLQPDDPVILLYADAAFRIAASWPSHDTVWTPLMRDIVAIERRFDRTSRKMLICLWYLTNLELERGDHAAAEPLAREGLDLVEKLQLSRDYLQSRNSHLGAVLAGKGQYATAEELLRSAYPPRLEKDITSTQCFGYLMDLYSDTARPDVAFKFAEPVMHRAIQQTRDAEYLETLAWMVVRRPGLGNPLYALALDLAIASSESMPNDASKLATLGAAYFRTQRFDEALATLSSADELYKDTSPENVAFLALTLARLNRPEEARQECDRLHQLIQGRGQWVSQILRDLQAEAKQSIR